MSSTVNFYPFRYYYCLLILLTFFSACFLSDLFGFSSYLEDQGFFYTYFIFFSFLLAPSCSSSYAQFLELVFFCLFLSFYYLQSLLGFYYYLQTCFTFCLYRSSKIKALFFVYFGSPFSIFFYYSLDLLLSACSPFYWIGYVGQTMMILSCGLGCCLMNAFPSSSQTTSVPLVDSKFNISFFLVRSTTQTYCLVGQWSESQSCILGLQIQLI